MSTIVTPDGIVKQSYPRIQVGRDVFPYKDLQIRGNWTRDVGIPDDIIPMMGPPIIYDDSWVPRVMRSTPEGYLRVYNENGGSGGSSTGQTPVANASFTSNAWTTGRWETGTVNGTKLISVSWGIVPNPSAVFPNNGEAAHLYLSPGGFSDALHLDTCVFVKSGTNILPPGYANTVTFDPYIVLPDNIGGSGAIVWISVDDNIQFVASVCFVAAL